METLRQIFEAHDDRLLNKWDHYIGVYEKYLEGYRNKKFVFAEIGVAHGGSLQMWRKYFGANAILIGIDINPECKRFEDENTKVYIGSQTDEGFLEKLKNEIPDIDVLIDDGGHTMNQQITTFKHLFTKVKPNGFYICEDTHTSYWKNFYGGYKKKTFIEFSKNIIDFLHGWHAEKSDKDKMFNAFTESVYGIHFYDSIVVIEKQKINMPRNVFKGKSQLTYHNTTSGQRKGIRKKMKSWIKNISAYLPILFF